LTSIYIGYIILSIITNIQFYEIISHEKLSPRQQITLFLLFQNSDFSTGENEEGFPEVSFGYEPNEVSHLRFQERVALMKSMIAGKPSIAKKFGLDGDWEYGRKLHNEWWELYKKCQEAEK
jgi:hypothetical protein